MSQISKEELLKIAKISNLALDEKEIPVMMQQVQDVLGYAARVSAIAKDVDLPSSKNINRVREDVSVTTDNQPILQQAPEHEEGYFVVPVIIEK